MKSFLWIFLCFVPQSIYVESDQEFSSTAGESFQKVSTTDTEYQKNLKRKLRQGDIGTNKYIASVKMYPSEFHMCDAFFIQPDLLLTTARCIYVQKASAMFIDLTSSKEDTGKIYQVKETIVHPDFALKPHSNDIGLIRLYKKVGHVAIYTIPSQEVLTNNKSYVFTWKFSQNQKKYTLRYIEVIRIPRSICSQILREYIDCEHICPASNVTILMGPYDQGSPLGEVVGKNSFFAWGIYNRLGPEYHLQTEKYTNLIPFRSWITKHF